VGQTRLDYDNDLIDGARYQGEDGEAAAQLERAEMAQSSSMAGHAAYEARLALLLSGSMCHANRAAACQTTLDTLAWEKRAPTRGPR
jgi:hypothetical protein